MNRRKFLCNTIPTAVTMPALINGFSFKAFGASDNALTHLLRGATATDHVLVLIQLSGGNDGINMVIPLNVYANYYNARTNVAIPQSKVLRLDGTDKSGLHPAMTDMQNLYNEGKMNVVQSVGYENPNFSHFQATDIWMSGDTTDNVTNRVKTGWMGRYLENEYPGYPDAYPNAEMPDPLAIQISNVPTLTVQGAIYSMGLSITDPENIYTFVNPFSDYSLTAPAANKELKFLRVISEKTKIYSDIIRKAYENASTMAVYPASNSLGDQLKIVARLIKGGKDAKNGILGKSPDIPADIQVVNNIPFQYDFRSVYASVLEQWFCVKQPELKAILLQNYQSLPLIKGGPCGLPDDINDNNNNADKLVLKMWPNPYTVSGTIQFSTTGGNTMIQQIDALGRVIKVLINQNYPAGTYNIDVYNDGLATGLYFLRLQNKSLQKVISVLKMP